MRSGSEYGSGSGRMRRSRARREVPTVEVVDLVGDEEEVDLARAEEEVDLVGDEEEVELVHEMDRVEIDDGRRVEVVEVESASSHSDEVQIVEEIGIGVSCEEDLVEILHEEPPRGRRRSSEEARQRMAAMIRAERVDLPSPSGAIHLSDSSNDSIGSWNDENIARNRIEEGDLERNLAFDVLDISSENDNGESDGVNQLQEEDLEPELQLQDQPEEHDVNGPIFEEMYGDEEFDSSGNFIWFNDGDDEEEREEEQSSVSERRKTLTETSDVDDQVPQDSNENRHDDSEEFDIEPSSPLCEQSTPENGESTSCSTSPESTHGSLEQYVPENMELAPQSMSPESTNGSLEHPIPENGESFSCSTSPESVDERLEQYIPENGESTPQSMSPESTSGTLEHSIPDNEESFSCSMSPESSNERLEQPIPEYVELSSSCPSPEVGIRSSPMSMEVSVSEPETEEIQSSSTFQSYDSNTNSTETRLVFYPKPDYSGLTKEEKKRFRGNLVERAKALYPICHLGKKYERHYPAFPPPTGDDYFPRSIKSEDPDGVIRNVLFRPVSSQAQYEADVAAGRCDLRLPPRQTPSFLEVLSNSLPRGTVPGQSLVNRRRNSGDNSFGNLPRPNQESHPLVSRPTQGETGNVEPQQPSTSKQATKNVGSMPEPQPSTSKQAMRNIGTSDPQPSTSKQAMRDKSTSEPLASTSTSVDNSRGKIDPQPSTSKQAKGNEGNRNPQKRRPFPPTNPKEAEAAFFESIEDLRNSRLPAYRLFHKMDELQKRIVASIIAKKLVESFEAAQKKRDDEKEEEERAKQEKRAAALQSKKAEREALLLAFQAGDRKRTRLAQGAIPRHNYNLVESQNQTPASVSIVEAPRTPNSARTTSTPVTPSRPGQLLGELLMPPPSPSTASSSVKQKKRTPTSSPAMPSRTASNAGSAPATPTSSRSSANRGNTTPRSGCPLRNSTGWVKDDTWEIERIVDSKIVVGKDGHETYTYKVKWRGWENKHNSWIEEDDFTGKKPPVKMYWRRYLRKIQELNRPVEIQGEPVQVEPTNSSYFDFPLGRHTLF